MLGQCLLPNRGTLKIRKLAASVGFENHSVDISIIMVKKAEQKIPRKVTGVSGKNDRVKVPFHFGIRKT